MIEERIRIQLPYPKDRIAEAEEMAGRSLTAFVSPRYQKFPCARYRDIECIGT